MSLSKTEKILLLVSVAAVWLVLAIYSGAPIFSDEFMYIDISLRNFKEPSYGNRFFHVYLQKMFMELAQTPLQGVRIFWGLTIALTLGMIYINARTFLRGSNPLHGLLAVLIFVSFPLMTEYSGEPAVDITAMLMVTIYMSLFLLGTRKPEYKNKVLMALGALAFLSFKTKETTIFINFLLIGFAVDENSRWSWRQVRDMLKPVLTGLALGILFNMLLDGLILGDPFFGISPATFGAIFTHYDFGWKFYSGPTSWYGAYFFKELTLPFMLFLISGLRLKDELNFAQKLVWIYPLLMIAFVTVNMIKIPWGLIERFYFPALPALAMLAPQFLRFELPKDKRSWFGFSLLFGLAMAVILLARAGLLRYAAMMHFDYLSILESLYYPVVLSMLLALVIWVKRFEWFSAPLVLFCIGAMLLSPLMYTAKYFFQYPKITERYSQLMHPFGTFKGYLSLKDDEKLYVSANLDRELDMLSDDPNDIVGMYNFYFDERISAANIFMGYSRATLYKDLTTRNFRRALLTQADWEWLGETAGDLSLVESMYGIRADERGLFLLLTRQ